MTKDRRVRKKGITGRWIVGSLLWTIVILIVGVLAVLSSLRENYYNSALLMLESRIERAYESVPTVLEAAGENSRALAVWRMVEEFTERDRFEFMIVGSDGRVLLTSSGFAYGVPGVPDDFYLAGDSVDRSASYMGYTEGGEHFLAYSKLFSSPIRNQIAGIRMVTSLKLIDAQLLEISYVLIVICVLILFFSIFSGSYFIRSIALPIRRIGNVAKQISGGDYDVRIESEYNDEIGDLCGIINGMAADLSSAERMKNDFISSVSHELRTPLTSIKGWGETLLAAGKTDEETFRKGMRIIMNETDRLSFMVEDLLDFSRMQTGGLSIQRAPCDIFAELIEAVMTFEKRAEGLGIRLVYEQPEMSGVVYADRGRMRQVFCNLLDNAIKYSKKGGAVTVTAGGEKDAITVSVADAGIGIPAEDLPKITEKFFRAGNSVTGSGIGLAVVREIVERHGGVLLIESGLGEGTCVKVTLPLMLPKGSQPREKESESR